MLSVVVAALSFSAPPSLTRRDMFGFGAAAAAMALPVAPAFAEVSKYAGTADAKKAAKLKADNQKKCGADTCITQYEYLFKDQKAQTYVAPTNEAEGRGAITSTLRKPTDPNGCSAECKAKRLAKYGY